MTRDDHVLLERHDHVLLVTLNRPESLNALSSPMLRALLGAWHEAEDPEVRAVVVTGAGKGFCAGADLRRREAPDPARDGLRQTFHPHILAMTGLPKPVIAAINGPVAGAGLAIAFGADIRVASDRAKLVPAFSQIGLVPDSGASLLVPEVIGYSKSFSWFARGDHLSPEQALAWGAVDEVVPADGLVARSLELAHELAGRPGSAVGLTKQLLRRATAPRLAEQLEAELHAQELAVRDPGRAAARAQVVNGLGKDQKLGKDQRNVDQKEIIK